MERNIWTNLSTYVNRYQMCQLYLVLSPHQIYTKFNANMFYNTVSDVIGVKHERRNWGGCRGYRRKEGEYKAISTSISVHVKLSIFLNNL